MEERELACVAASSTRQKKSAVTAQASPLSNRASTQPPHPSITKALKNCRASQAASYQQQQHVVTASAVNDGASIANTADTV